MVNNNNNNTQTKVVLKDSREKLKLYTFLRQGVSTCVCNLLLSFVSLKIVLLSIFIGSCMVAGVGDIDLKPEYIFYQSHIQYGVWYPMGSVFLITKLSAEWELALDNISRSFIPMSSWTYSFLNFPQPLSTCVCWRFPNVHLVGEGTQTKRTRHMPGKQTILMCWLYVC